MTDPKKKFAIVGGGIAGIGAIKLLKDEGLEPVCFEKTSKPGGTWCYREEAKIGESSIMPTTVINHSKELGALSAFPPKKEYNNYMRHTEMYSYFREFWQHFDLLKHVKFNMEVIGVKRHEDYEKTGKWYVTVKNVLTDEESSDVYDGVLICIGQLGYPHQPTYPGQEKFKGKILHSHSLKHVDPYKGQSVVVVGIGCSALDAAVGISNVAKQVYLSTRSGAYIINRVGPRAYPIDYVVFRRYLTNFLDILPAKWCSWFLETFYLNRQFDPKLYNVKPKHDVLSKDPCVNDMIASKLLSGAVLQVKDIHHFTEDGVVFDGDDHVTEADTVIMATGYELKFPFLEDGIFIKEDKSRADLYKCIFPTHLKHPTLAIIGIILPFGPGIPVGELQVRYAVRVFAGKCSLPSEKAMLKDVRRRIKANSKRFPLSEKNSLRVDFVQYADELASLIGAKPNLAKYFFTDIRLFWKLYFGPAVPYQYRLQGPDKWEGAREAILTAKQRIKAPLQRDKMKSK